MDLGVFFPKICIFLKNLKNQRSVLNSVFLANIDYLVKLPLSKFEGLGLTLVAYKKNNV